MSAFDDEFGLFDDEAHLADDDERRSTLGARTVSSGETIIDEIEMDDDDRPRGQRRGRNEQAGAGAPLAGGPRRHRFDERRPSAEPSVLRDRAVELLLFLAKGLVSKPEFIAVAAHEDPRQGMVLELEVAADDLGKVIGRGGRVAQALRTVVRAGAEGRVAIEIIDVEDDSEEVALTVVEAEVGAETSEAAVVTHEAVADAVPKKKPRALRARRPRAKKDADAVDAAVAEPPETE